MSIKALSDYIFTSKYSLYNQDLGRKETWDEAVSRVFDMHRAKYASIMTDELSSIIDECEEAQKQKKVLSSQRNLQFGGDPILKHELKSYNCLTTHINRKEVFAECMYALLCGCGVGFSVQKHHIKQLPKIKVPSGKTKTLVLEDSIEGWADAVKGLMLSYFDGSNPVKFDFSKIRPEGSLIAGRYLAPGPKGLEKSLEKIRELLNGCAGRKLRPINAYDIIMHISDSVLSGGVRRSATLCLFSPDDEEMATAKTGFWFNENPQRARSNNSAALIKDKVTKEEFDTLLKSTREFGEPGIIFVHDEETVFNPCSEVCMRPIDENGKHGWQGCNLTEINGKYCTTSERFYEACRISALIGTLQAGYTSFNYLDPCSEKIFEREALLGCSITGMMDNPDILFDPKVQRKGAKIILEENAKMAKLLGINPAARSTVVKPAGTTSCILGTASGVHPHHARRYIRRAQANKNEATLQLFEKYNPLAVEDSVWSNNGTDMVTSFLCEVPAGAITKNQLSAVDLLKKVKLTQDNWVEYGTREELCTSEGLRHCVSNTITVRPDEWDDVGKYIFKNRQSFAGVSLLPFSGDLDYPQAPFSTVLTPNELVKEYGDASVFASGLVVDGLTAFNNNLWNACDCVLGLCDLEDSMEEPVYPKKRNYNDLAQYFQDRADYDSWFLKTDWVRRVKQFAYRYFDGDTRRTTYCLKHVSLWKTWCDLYREYQDIDWTEMECPPEYQNADEQAAIACSGGQCEI